MRHWKWYTCLALDAGLLSICLLGWAGSYLRVMDLTLRHKNWAGSVVAAQGYVYFVTLSLEHVSPDWELGGKPAKPTVEGWQWQWLTASPREVDDYTQWYSDLNSDPGETWGVQLLNEGCPLRWSNLASNFPRGSMLRLPWWMMVLPLALAPLSALALSLHRRGQQASEIRKGHCPHCGYDWRTTPGRCPECGFGQNPVSR